ncbi:hypothetical protein RHA1_ro00750 [Rhodococcus jostii RHA1]|uniref:Uncharacterized protein n=1 Tax=Rhodococcus jostii (strain RHA1) TaxID=101510 RepID=Q0SIQ1_RHOJR|nr:hypothetical protein RHA1_ro00750 [Rhodococcus jostii RHA1]
MRHSISSSAAWMVDRLGFELERWGSVVEAFVLLRGCWWTMSAERSSRSVGIWSRSRLSAIGRVACAVTPSIYVGAGDGFG